MHIHFKKSCIHLRIVPCSFKGKISHSEKHTLKMQATIKELQDFSRQSMFIQTGWWHICNNDDDNNNDNDNDDGGNDDDDDLTHSIKKTILATASTLKE